jgi:hypothetical protein
MAFPDDFVTCMQQYGVSIDGSSLPDEDTLKQAIDYAVQTLQSVDGTAQQMLEAATEDPGASAVALADGSVNVAPALESLLTAFDQVQGGVTYLLQAAQYCCTQVQPAASSSAS